MKSISALCPLFLVILALGVVSPAAAQESRPPNVVIMFADDLGYGDLSCYGAEGYATPNLDRIAAEGARFTDFYVSSPVCSASRAALLTGCYHERVGVSGAYGPTSPNGLHPEETTLAEVCKGQGYATCAVGKWHLGRPTSMLPTSQGFDEYFGLPYSNDMWPFHPASKSFGDLPLIENGKVIDPLVDPADQRDLTVRYTEKAVDFIDRNHEKPFFLYVAQSQPHVPLYVSERFEGFSKRGLFGDVISEIDWSMGEIQKALDKHGLTENTLVIFTSDNGPWLSYGDHCGTAGPLREGKGTCWDGGIRVPFVAKWPAKIPAGLVCKEPACTIDLLPTIAGLIDAPLPERKIDGKDILPLLTSADAKSPHKALFFYYKKTELQSMRSGKWKLIFPHQYRTLAGAEGGKDGFPVRYGGAKSGLELYDVTTDIGEQKDLAADFPEVVEQLKKKAEAMRADLGDKLTKVQGSGRRAAGTDEPVPVQRTEPTPEAIQEAVTNGRPKGFKPAKPPTGAGAAAMPASDSDTADGFLVPEGTPDAHTDVSGFGSNEVAPRDEHPERGQIAVHADQIHHVTESHWEQFEGEVTMKRWGRYRVLVKYSLNRAGWGIQFKMGEQRLRNAIKGTGEDDYGLTDIGTIYVEKPGKFNFAVYTPPAERHIRFLLEEVRFVPAPEGETTGQAADGSLVLLAKNATTWSETMRYEPKEEKNCLGFWVSKDDWAEWEVEIDEPGKFQVVVSQGNKGHAGSTVAVESLDGKVEFTVIDTGGFQNWQDVEAGVLEIKKPGLQRIAIKPQTQAKGAVMDIQKIVLTPVKP